MFVVARPGTGLRYNAGSNGELQEARVLTIDALMKRKMVTAAPTDSVEDASRLMRDASVGAILVVEGGDLAGIFSERDLVKRVIAEGKDPAGTQVGAVATREVVTVGADASLRTCAEELKSHQFRHLPVVDGKRPVGIISARDFFEAVSGELERFIEHARYDEQLRENLDPYDHIGGSYGR
jgi:CBS domain-containing protein